MRFKKLSLTLFLYCYALTPTYRGKNKKNNVYRQAGVVELAYTEDLSPSPEKDASSSLVTRTSRNCCIDCGKENSTGSERCKPCAGKVRQGTKIDWPSKQELLDRLEVSNYSRLGRELGVSDNAIRKYLAREKNSEWNF